MYKDFKDYSQLIKILKDRKLLINDESEATKILEKVHYYRLSAYFIPFQYPKNSENKDIFKPHTNFEDIVALYRFDAQLRAFVFDYLERLEIVLRAQISHVHAKKYGPFGYIEDINSLKRNMRIANGGLLFDEFIMQANKEKERASEDFIRHIKEKYKIDDLPIWALVEIISFGNLSKFFKLMHTAEQIAILRFFSIDSLRLNVFENWLETLSYTRNICAHHSRLWNKNFVKKFKYDKGYEFLDTTIKRDKIFFALSVLAEILKDTEIKDKFAHLLQQCPIDISAMGVPKNWQALTPWSVL